MNPLYRLSPLLLFIALLACSRDNGRLAQSGQPGSRAARPPQAPPAARPVAPPASPHAAASTYRAAAPATASGPVAATKAATRIKPKGPRPAR
jgi:hypothetical protein